MHRELLGTAFNGSGYHTRLIPGTRRARYMGDHDKGGLKLLDLK
jgi:hypothetical protein